MPERLTQEVDSEDAAFSRTGRWIVGGAFIGFLIGIALFMTIGMERSGDEIPLDAAPSHFMHDASL